MTTLWQDLRYGVRMLRKSPGFTVIALITLAIGIGANTVMFSLSDLLLVLRPRKVKNPEQLAFCGIRNAQFPWFQYPAYLAVRESGLAFRDVMAQDIDVGSSFTLVQGDSAWQVRALYVSSNYFSFLGTAPAQGRVFLPEEEQAGCAPVAVLSHRCWQRLGRDPKLVGAFVNINGTRCQIVGVASEGFTGATLIGYDLWLSLGSYKTVDMLPRRYAKREYPSLHLVGRLKAGTTLPIAQAQLQALVPRFKLEYPREWENYSAFDLRPTGRFVISGDYEEMHLTFGLFSLALMAASTIILGIACLNLANMLIVQGTSRHREIAIRLALGGGRLCIIRQLLIESGLLALLGGALGVLLAFWGMRILGIWIAAVPDNWVSELQPDLNVRVLAGTLGVCLIALLLSSLSPALRLSRRDIAGEIRESAGRVMGSLRRKRTAFSVAGQIALAVALVLSATLLMRSALQVARPDPRFALEDKLAIQIDPLSAGYDRNRSVQAYEALADHLASLPDVQALGTSNRLLFTGGGAGDICEYLPGVQEKGSRRLLPQEGAVMNVGRDYFAALEIPLLRGRLFDRLDSVPHAERVAIIDESLARKLRPDGNALDCLVQFGLYGNYIDPYRVVGIVANMPGVREREVVSRMYTPAEPNQVSSCLYLRVAQGGPADLLRPRIATEIRRFDPRIPLLSVATLAHVRHNSPSVWLARFGAHLALTAGAAALFLAALGIYAIKGYMVASRTSEIGIRMALGATREGIMGMVLREGLVLTPVGLVVGLLLGLAVAEVSARLLYGVRPIDPVSIVVTVALLGAASLLAGYLPARRAARIDPMEALRYE